MKNKLIIIPNNIDNINKLKNVGITAFLFPVEKYSIGYNTFSIDEINSLKCNKYLLINRILNTKEIDDLIKDINLYTDIKGIFFDNIGICYALNSLNIEKIYYSMHSLTNYHSIDYLLSQGITSAVVSNDITLNEIKYISDNINDKLVYFLYGKSPIMYSRRNLVSNFNRHYNCSVTNPTIIEKVSKKEFKLVDNNDGTIAYDNNYYNGLLLMNTIDISKIKYYLVSLIDVNDGDVIKLIESIIENDNQKLLSLYINTNIGFLNTETIYRVKGTDKND